MRDSLILISEQIKAQLVAYNDYCTNWQDHRLTDGEKKTYTISEKINPDKLNFHRRKQSLGMHVPSIHPWFSVQHWIYLSRSFAAREAPTTVMIHTYMHTRNGEPSRTTREGIKWNQKQATATRFNLIYLIDCLGSECSPGGEEARFLRSSGAALAAGARFRSRGGGVVACFLPNKPRSLQLQ